MAIRETIRIDVTHYRKDLRKVEDAAERTARGVEQSWDRSSREMRQDSRRTTSEMQGGFKKIGTAAKMWIATIATSAFYTLRKALIRSQEIEETASKFETVLGPSIGKANEFIKENARLMGLSRTEAQEMIATTTAIAQGMNFTGSEAADLGFDIVKLAGDLQSFNDVPIERTHNAITTALTGEREALKSLGIVIRETEVQERALANTGRDAADALTQQEKATATLELITQKAGVAVGDLERTATSSANRTRQSMANIQTLLDTLASKLNQSFGPQLITWLENALEIAEDLVSTIDRSMSSDMENLIRNLEAQGGSEELVARLKKQQAINEAIALKKELKQELGELEVAVGIDEKVMKDRINETMSALKGTLLASPLNDFFGEEGGIMDTFNELTKSFQDDFKTVNESFDPAKIDEYNARIEEMQEQLRTVSEQAIKAEEMGFDEEAESLAQMSNTLTDAITSMQLAIGKNQQLANVNKTLSELQNQSASAMSNQNEEAEEQTRQFGAVAAGFQNIKVAWNELGSSMATGPGSIMKTHFQQLIEDAGSYENTIRRLKNELELEEISREKYNEESEKATAKYLKQLQDTYSMFKDQLGPEQQKMFEALIANLKKTTKEAGKTDASLSDITETVNNILTLADAFWDVDENLRNVLRGSVDLIRNMKTLQEIGEKLGGTGFLNLGGLNTKDIGAAGLIPAIGVASGVVSIVSGLMSALSSSSGQSNEEIYQQMQEMRDLRLSLVDLQRAVKENTKAYLGEPVVGGNIPTGDLDRAKSLFEGLFTGSRDRGGDPFGYADEETFLANLSELSSLFPQVFGEFQDMYQNLRDQGLSHTAAVSRLMREGLGEAFRVIEDSFQEYGASIEGSIKRFNDAINYGALTTEEAFALFLEQLEKAGFDLEQMVGDKSLGDLLNELADPDLTEEQRTSIIDLLWDNRDSLLPDNVSFDSYTQFLDFLKGLEDSVSGQGEEGFSKSAQINRTITDIQANEVIVLLEWIGDAVWNLVDIARGDAIANGLAPILNLPDIMSESGTIENTLIQSMSSPSSKNFTTYVNLEAPKAIADLTSEDIDQLSRQFANQFKNEMRFRRGY